MEHVVFFPAHDGTPAFRRVASLPDAVRLVEHLRNVENVSEVSVHALTEVPLAFKPYYKVEIPTGEAEPEAAPAAEDARPEGPITLAPEAGAPEAGVEVPEQGEAPVEDSAESAEKKDGAASLGFFAS